MGKWLIKIGNAIVDFNLKLKILWNKMVSKLMFSSVDCGRDDCVCKK